MNEPSRKLSTALPVLFRRRGGSILDSLLRQVDDAWERLTDPWPPGIVPGGNDLDGLDQWARMLGWGHVIDHRGIAQIKHPDRLLRVHECLNVAIGSLLRYWLDCLFGAELVQCDLCREARADVPPHYRVTICRIPADGDLPQITRVVAELLPAHVTFTLDVSDGHCGIQEVAT